jgi:hypothetical protein
VWKEKAMSLIELRPHEGNYVPVLMCEKCHRPIKSVYEAMLYNEPEKHRYMVCHKNTCDPGWSGSLELRDILAQIVKNYIGVDMKISQEGFSEIKVKPTLGFKNFIEHLKE